MIFAKKCGKMNLFQPEIDEMSMWTYYKILCPNQKLTKT